MNNTTPRTDALAKHSSSEEVLRHLDYLYVVPSNFARQLERELSAAKLEVERLTSDCNHLLQLNADHVKEVEEWHGLRDRIVMRMEIAGLNRSNIAVMVESCIDEWKRQSKELDTLRKSVAEKDDLHVSKLNEAVDALKSIVYNCNNCMGDRSQLEHIIKGTANRVIQQADRVIEAREGAG